MAYMSQESKAKIAPKIKAVLAKYKVKGSLSVRNHSTLVLNLKSGAIDFIANSNKVCTNDFYQMARGFTPNTSGYDQVNPYHFKDHYDGVALAFMKEIFVAMKGADWYDNSDAQTDYFDTAYYVDVNIGKWNKGYILTA
jgi:hypothetical protein